MRFFRLVVFLSVTLFAAAARAQSVHWESTDDPNDLVLAFTNCSPEGDPKLPAITGAQLTFTGTSENSQFSFGFGTGSSSTRTVNVHYAVRARAGTAIAIPAFTVNTDKGAQRVPAFNITAASRANAAGAGNIATSRLTPPDLSVWAGEIFPLTYTLDVARANYRNNFSGLEWNPAGVIVEEWSKPEPSAVNLNGEARVYVPYQTRAYAKNSGPVDLDGVKQAIEVGVQMALLPLQQGVRQDLESNPLHLTVRALPPAPAGFIGAVGQLKLVSKVIPEKASVGEPVTWTLELSGTANWPEVGALPARDVSKDFQVVQPKAKRTAAEGKIFDATLGEDVVLVPTKAGSYTLGPVEVVYFDPKAGAYKTLTAPRTTLVVAAPDAPKFTFNIAGNAPADNTTGTTASPETKALPPPAVPAAPAGIPRDPLPGSDIAPLPLASSTLLWLVLAPFVVPLALWAWLAVSRAQRTDPARARREARARLGATLAQLRSGAASPQLLLAWQRDSAVLWQIAHAAPSATALTDAAWAQLWSECDRALYGAKNELPSDWLARAEAALEAKRAPGFNPLRAFLPRNLLPFAALVAVTFVSFAALRAADLDAASAYRRGDFATAEKTWRAALEKNPTDSLARHNLSLALSQQDRHGEAAAQAAAAFVQNPPARAIAWHFGLTAEKSGAVPPPLAAFLNPGPLQALAVHLAPPAWQRVLIGASTVFALALAWLLANSYGNRSRLVLGLACGGLVLALLVAASALLGWQAYGETADARAVVVWRTGTLRSIPTEADVTQKTTPLAAGSVALADNTFLGWTRLAFENGQTGWVRTSELVALWR